MGKAQKLLSGNAKEDGRKLPSRGAEGSPLYVYDVTSLPLHLSTKHRNKAQSHSYDSCVSRKNRSFGIVLKELTSGLKIAQALHIPDHAEGERESHSLYIYIVD